MGVLLAEPAAGEVVRLAGQLVGIVRVCRHAVEFPSRETSRGAARAVPAALRGDISDVAVIAAADERGGFHIVPADAELLLDGRLDQSGVVGEGVDGQAEIGVHVRPGVFQQGEGGQGVRIDDVERSGAVVVRVVAMDATMTHSADAAAQNVGNAGVVILHPVLDPVGDGLGGSLDDGVCGGVSALRAVEREKHRTRAHVPVFKPRIDICGILHHIAAVPVKGLRRFEHPAIDIIFAAGAQLVDRVPIRFGSGGLIPIGVGKQDHAEPAAVVSEVRARTRLHLAVDLGAAPFEHGRRLAGVDRPCGTQGAGSREGKADVDAADPAADHLQGQRAAAALGPVHRHGQVLDGSHEARSVVSGGVGKRNAIRAADQIARLKPAQGAGTTGGDGFHGDQPGSRNNVAHAADASERNVERRRHHGGQKERDGNTKGGETKERGFHRHKKTTSGTCAFSSPITRQNAGRSFSRPPGIRILCGRRGLASMPP